MAANTQQIFSKAAKIGWCTIKAATTAMTGAGTLDALGAAVATTGHLGTIFVAGSEGGRVERIRFQPVGTNVKTVARIFLNNGSTNATTTNNSLIAEVELPATTAASDVRSGAYIEIPTPVQVDSDDATVLPLVLPSGYKLMVALGTAVSAGWAVTAIGGDY